MANWPQIQVAFRCSDSCFGLLELQIPIPKLGGIFFRPVALQQIGSLSLLSPLASIHSTGDGQPAGLMLVIFQNFTAKNFARCPITPQPSANAPLHQRLFFGLARQGLVNLHQLLKESLLLSDQDSFFLLLPCGTTTQNKLILSG